MMTGVGCILGTAAYMSPGAGEGTAADKRSDIWAFGVVLYEMLTGRRAFEGEDIAERSRRSCARSPTGRALAAVVRPCVRRC